MKPISGKEFCVLLEKRNWLLKRINGSHYIYAKDGNMARISVPVHANKTLKIGLQKHIMKLAQIEEKEL